MSATETDDDPFVAALVEAMMSPIPDGPSDFDLWYREHGSGAGVAFEGGFFLPGMIESVRFATFRDQGLDAMRDLDAQIAAEWNDPEARERSAARLRELRAEAEVTYRLGGPVEAP